MDKQQRILKQGLLYNYLEECPDDCVVPIHKYSSVDGKETLQIHLWCLYFKEGA